MLTKERFRYIMNYGVICLRLGYGCEPYLFACTSAAMANGGRSMNNTVIKTENIAPKQRNASLDLLRVLAMLMIVMGHCIGHGGVASALYGKTSFNYIIIETVNTFIHVHVNCFVLVSGYFLCTGKFKLSKWLQLWATALFWSVLLYVILSVTGNTGFSLKGLFRACLPFTNQRYWFLTTYLLMYMLSPICNIAIRSMDQKQHMTAIGAFFAVFICLQNVVY